MSTKLTVHADPKAELSGGVSAVVASLPVSYGPAAGAADISALDGEAGWTLRVLAAAQDGARGVVVVNPVAESVEDIAAAAKTAAAVALDQRWSSNPAVEGARHALQGYLDDAALLDSVAIAAPGTQSVELLTQHLALIQDLGVGLETLRLVQHGPTGYVAAGSLANGAPMALQGITTSAVRPRCSVTVLNSTGGLELTVPDPDAAWPAEILVTNPSGSTLLPTLYESAHRSTWTRLKKHLDAGQMPTDLARFGEVASAVHRLTGHRATP
ncbi:hypothetical protein [Arthrobacter sp. B2a2-09]|uniref:hypothetical protein n=1 Tax=Arthrobacter sp. B2a2-09 TaxID=2952822 RepID=UPI0022CD53EB|nr:hypothetical protein [Arthrobacter sp. B2a2-09]MCZ9881648.1 hypothetical protein [Arthrobacter sp. B2a2-09]